MALLDVFQIVFETNSGDAITSMKQVGKAAESVNAGIEQSAKQSAAASTKAAQVSADASKKAASEAENSVKNMATNIGKVLGSLAAAWISVSAGMERITEINAISQTAETIGDSIQNVDAFGRAIVLLGGDANGARDSMVDLAESTGEALRDTESGKAKAFKELGITIKDANGNAKSTTETFLELAGAVEGLGKQKAISVIKELGITDNRSVELLLKGRKEVERMFKAQKEQGLISDRTAKSTREFSESLNFLKGSLVNGTSGFMDALIPALTAAVKWLTTVVDWVQENQTFVTGFFIAVGSVVAAVYVPAMLSAAAATIAANAPLILMVATVAAVGAAFALIYDDIMNFIEGNDSFIGQIFEKYPALAELVFFLVDAFKSLGGVIVDTMVGAWNVIKPILGFIGDAISNIISAISKVGGAANWVAGALGFGKGGSSSVEQGQGALSSANSNPMNSTTSNAISNQGNMKSESNVSIGQVTVQAGAATDAQGIAASLPSELPKQIRNLKSETATGVAR